MTSILETFFRHHANPAWICEGDALRFAETNDAAVSRYGLPLSRFADMTLRDLQPGIAPNLASVRMMREDPQSAAQEVLQHRFADGSTLELTLRGIALDIGTRNYRLVISRDVSQSAEPSRTSRQLAYVERQAARIAAIGGWRFDTAAQTFAYSPAALAILALGPGDRGAPADILRTVAPDDRTAVLAAFEACASFGETIDRAFTATDRQGRIRQLRIIAEPEFELSGKVAGVIGVVQDMTGYQADETHGAPAWAREPERDLHASL